MVSLTRTGRVRTARCHCTHSLSLYKTGFTDKWFSCQCWHCSTTRLQPGPTPPLTEALPSVPEGVVCAPRHIGSRWPQALQHRVGGRHCAPAEPQSESKGRIETLPLQLERERKNCNHNSRVKKRTGGGGVSSAHRWGGGHCATQTLTQTTAESVTLHRIASHCSMLPLGVPAGCLQYLTYAVPIQYTHYVQYRCSIQYIHCTSRGRTRRMPWLG